MLRLTGNITQEINWTLVDRKTEQTTITDDNEDSTNNTARLDTSTFDGWNELVHIPASGSITRDLKNLSFKLFGRFASRSFGSIIAFGLYYQGDENLYVSTSGLSEPVNFFNEFALGPSGLYALSAPLQFTIPSGASQFTISNPQSSEQTVQITVIGVRDD